LQFSSLPLQLKKLLAYPLRESSMSLKAN
jgi:hypothetical protein